MYHSRGSLSLTEKITTHILSQPIMAGVVFLPGKQASVRASVRDLFPVTVWTQASPAKFFKALLSTQSSAIIWQVLFSTLNMATAVPPQTTNDKKIYPLQQTGLITASSAWKQITIYSFTIYKSEVLCSKNA